jgi:hypothetical protein
LDSLTRRFYAFGEVDDIFGRGNEGHRIVPNVVVVTWRRVGLVCRILLLVHISEVATRGWTWVDWDPSLVIVVMQLAILAGEITVWVWMTYWFVVPAKGEFRVIRTGIQATALDIHI